MPEAQETVAIDRQINKGGQSAKLYEIIEYCDKKFKISIKSDACDFQSHAKIYLFNGEEWKLIYSIHYNEMTTPHKLVYHDHVRLSNFARDRQRLINTALNIVS